MTHLEVIGLWPSPTALARALGCPVHTVFGWKNRERIPPSRFGEIVAAARAAGLPGVTLEALHAGAPSDAPAQRRRPRDGYP